MYETFELFGGFHSSFKSAGHGHQPCNHVLCGNNCMVNNNVLLDDCVGYKRLRDALQVHFKYDNFRPGQLEALLPVVHGKDVFAYWWRKVTVHFLAPLAISCAITIVVSPLTSLMDQQVSVRLHNYYLYKCTCVI